MKNPSLFPHQSDIITRLYAAWEEHPSVMVQMPTGTGKTHVLAAVTRDFVSRNGTCVWIVAHRRELVSQIEATLARYGLRGPDSGVRALSIQWLCRHWDEMPSAPGLVIIDEAHHALAESYCELWRRFPSALKLGMTATPCRLNRRGFDDLFDLLITSAPVLDFVRAGRLSKYDYISIAGDSREQQQVNSLQKRGADGDFQLKELSRVFNRKINISHLYQSVQQYAAGKKGIVYAIDIAHARNISDYYSAHGLRSAAIDSRTPASRRQALVDRFRSGDIDVLVNVDVFSEGFDCPDVEFVQMARPTLSLSKYLQQAGRGLRISPGKDACVLIDNVGLYRLFGLPTDVRDWERMFHGSIPGKGVLETTSETLSCRFGDWSAVEEDNDPVSPRMVVVMQRDRLLLSPAACDGDLVAVRCGARGPWGLSLGGRPVYPCVLSKVLGVAHGYAVARNSDRRLCVISRTGAEVVLPAGASRVVVERQHTAKASLRGAGSVYVDLRSGGIYSGPLKLFTAPESNVEFCLCGNELCSRTRHLYRAPLGVVRRVDMERYSLFADRRRVTVTAPDRLYVDDGCHYVCLFPHDYDTYYYLCSKLPDDSIVVMDARDEVCYHCTTDGLLNRLPEDYESALRSLQRHVSACRPSVVDHLEPFCIAGRWGLRCNNRIVCLPRYPMIRPPVGNYCAFQSGARYWGILGADGSIKLPANYSEVVIHPDGTADVSVAPGHARTIQLER